MGPDEFISVTADLVRRLGSANAALVWARINFVCQVPGAGRVEDETGRWWVASMAKLSDDIGLSQKAIRRTLDNLIEAGHLEAKMVDESSWDRSLAYRTIGVESAGQPHLPKRSNASAQTGECISPNGQIDVPERANLLYGKEDKNKDSVVASDSDPFDEWWTAYPKKEGKIDARKKYKQALKLVDADTLLSACKAYRHLVESELRPRKYILNPSTWLNQGHWEDENIAPATTDDLIEWLRERWQDADTLSVSERSGLVCRIPDPPEDVDIVEFRRQARRQWIDDNLEEIISRIMAREASAA